MSSPPTNTTLSGPDRVLRCDGCNGKVFDFTNARRVITNPPGVPVWKHYLCEEAKAYFPFDDFFEMSEVLRNHPPHPTQTQTSQKRPAGYVIAYRCHGANGECRVSNLPEKYVTCLDCGQRHRYTIVREIWR